MHASNVINAFTTPGLIGFLLLLLLLLLLVVVVVVVVVVVELPVRSRLGLIDNVPAKVADVW
jgi:predicted neutral ceramidase superfamily lipid hydrolase